MAWHGEKFALNEAPMPFEMVGIATKKAWEAVAVGVQRLKDLREQGAGLDALQREFAITDPLVKAFIFVGCQRAAFALSRRMMEARYILRDMDLLGLDSDKVVSDADMAALYDKMWASLDAYIKSFREALITRVEQLQDAEEHDTPLAPWPYDDLAGSSKPVELTPEQDAFSSNILRSLFG